MSTETYGYTDSSWKDLLTSFKGTTITYDTIGNPLSYYNGQSYTFTWENGKQLAKAVTGGKTVKTGLHRRLHTNMYYGWTNNVVISAHRAANGDDTQERLNVINALNAIRAFLQTLNDYVPY